MPTIQILPDEVANKIAAGEVVERPAAVVKELVENAIDAGGDRIVIDVAAGGREAIRVSDNGSGMDREDALLALERHATSKIRHFSDLNVISTLGFRGEALPSIAAVSRLVLETRVSEADAGTYISVEGGVVREVNTVGRDAGTTVSVLGLFYNVPARRKFLRGIETEMRHIVACVSKVGLAFPGLNLILSHNGRPLLRLSPGDRKQRIEAVFGLNLDREAVKAKVEEEGIRVNGFLGKPNFVRRSGTHQVFLINDRPIQNRTFTKAVLDGYGGLISRGNFPFYVLYIEVPGDRVDVNVHPTKREVRLDDDRRFYKVISKAVRRAMRDADVIPEVSPDSMENHQDEQGGHRSYEGSYSRPSLVRESSDGYGLKGTDRRRFETTPFDLDSQISLSLIEHKPSDEDSEGGETAVDADPESETVSVWQMHETYIMAEIKNGLIIVDQHVAHERIIFEETLRAFQSQPTAGQQLLFPLSISLSLPEMVFLKEVTPMLERLGFGIRDLGGNSAVVDAIPTGLRKWNDGKLLKEIIEDLREEEKPKSRLEEQVATSYACHTAIRAGERLSTREMKTLIDRLFAAEDPFVCPHGRPIVVKMALEEIHRRFGR